MYDVVNKAAKLRCEITAQRVQLAQRFFTHIHHAADLSIVRLSAATRVRGSTTVLGTSIAIAARGNASTTQLSGDCTQRVPPLPAHAAARRSSGRASPDSRITAGVRVAATAETITSSSPRPEVAPRQRLKPPSGSRDTEPLRPPGITVTVPAARLLRCAHSRVG